MVSYGVTWLLWLPVALASYGVPSFSNPYVPTWFDDFVALRASTPAHWMILGGGVLGPLAGALVAWHRISDWRGWLGALLPLGYFALASLALLIIAGVAYLPHLGPLQFAGLLAVGSVLVAGEELGWRGT